MAVAMCIPPPAPPGPGATVVDSDRFYKFGTPSPPSAPEYSPSCYSELEEGGFQSDEEIQKVRLLYSSVCCVLLGEHIHELCICVNVSHARLDNVVAPVFLAWEIPLPKAILWL